MTNEPKKMNGKKRKNLDWARTLAKFSQELIDARSIQKTCKDHERKVVTAFSDLEAAITLETTGPDYKYRQAAVLSNEDIIKGQARLDQAYAKTRSAQLKVSIYEDVNRWAHELNLLVVNGFITAGDALSLIENGEAAEESKPNGKPDPAPDEIKTSTVDTVSTPKAENPAVVIEGVKWTG